MGKCITCGFLCKYVPGHDVPTPKFFEMENHERGTAFAYHHYIPVGRNAPSCPDCFRGVEDVQMALTGIRNKPPAQFNEIVNKDRQCTKWMQYQPGFSPMDHLQGGFKFQVQRVNDDAVA